MGLRPIFFRDPKVFWLGLLLRLFCIFLFAPFITGQWFAPFLAEWIATPSFDPWTAHAAMGGPMMAFPYGPAMFLFLLPGVALGMLLDLVAGFGGGAIIGYGLAILAAEFFCLAMIYRLQKDDAAVVYFWLSPAVIIIAYWHGQNDLVPVAAMLASIVLLKRHRPVVSGIALGLAIAAKLSMVLAAPVLAVYLYRNTRLRGLLKPFLAGLAGPVLLQGFILLISPGSRAMVLGTPEAQKVFQLAFDLGSGLKIYVLPVVYLLVLFWAWRLRRMSFDLLTAVLGIVFLLVVLLTPASPGWFLWAAPFLALHAGQTGSRGLILVTALSVLQALLTLIQFPGASIPALGLDLTAPLASVLAFKDAHYTSLLVSVFFALGLFIAHRIWTEGVKRNELYRMSRRPLVLGVAGDSGAGKDTLVLGIAGIFGEGAVASIAGDNYHLWERARPMWTAMTHLNPRANDLERMESDALRLISGETVHARHYDHHTGRFTKPEPVAFTDVVVVSGLHALLMPNLRTRYDVQIYLDIDEGLRRYFKIRRDVHERGHALAKVVESMDRRMADADHFVKPQRESADIIFSLQPVNSDHIADPMGSCEPKLKLHVLLRHAPYYEALARVLIGLCGLHVDVSLHDGSQAVDVMIEGDIEAEDIAFAARLLVPNLDELVALDPAWQGGVTGLMQLIVLTHAAYAIRAGEVEI